MIKQWGKLFGVNGVNMAIWGKHRVKTNTFIWLIFAVKCTNRLSANQAVTTVKQLNYNWYKNNILRDSFLLLQPTPRLVSNGRGTENRHMVQTSTWQNFTDEGSPPCSPQIPHFKSGRTARPLSTAISTSWTYTHFDRVPGTGLLRFFSRYTWQEWSDIVTGITEGHLSPLVPEREALCNGRQLISVNAARGISIMVPTLSGSLHASFRNNAAAASDRITCCWARTADTSVTANVNFRDAHHILLLQFNCSTSRIAWILHLCDFG